MRRLLPVLFVVAAIIAGPAAAGDRTVERGIVQRIGPDHVVLRALDGARVTVLLGPDTRLRLNGRRVGVEAIQPGLVAEAVTADGGPARVLRAFGRVTRPRVRGRVVRVASHSLIVRGGGARIRIPVTHRTTAWRGQARIRVRSLRRGMRVDVRLAANGTALTILVVRGVA